MRIAIALVALVLIASDAAAGPLARLRARKSGGCTPTAGRPLMAVASGCANGACSIK